MSQEIRKCPKCGNLRIWKYGKLPSVQKGKRQRFKCAECGTTFF